MHKYTKHMVDFCRRELNLKDNVNAYKYQSMSVCIIDCVFSLRARYKSTTKEVVNRYAIKYMEGDENALGNTISDLINNIEYAGGPVAFAGKEFLDNKQLSGGVLKTEVCFNLAKYLKYLHIEQFVFHLNF